jgi:hypothetical protein
MIKVNPEKIRAIQAMKPPTKRREVQSFLGLTSYFRRHIEGFSRMARPLHELTKKDTEFTWTVRHQLAFQGLIDALSSAPVLALPNWNRWS